MLFFGSTDPGSVRPPMVPFSDSQKSFFPFRPPEDLAEQADALLHRVRARPEDDRLLRDGVAESAAAWFGVSEYVVAEARRRLLAEEGAGTGS